VIPWTVARSHLARAIQRGDPPERIAELRRDYYASRARDYLADLVAIRGLTAEQRRELADVILAGGDRDAAA
jgi:hypothetical protein